MNMSLGPGPFASRSFGDIKRPVNVLAVHQQLLKIIRFPPRTRGHEPSHESVVTNQMFCSTVAVVVAFFICWAPFHAQRLMAIHTTDPPTSLEVIIFTLLTHISGITYYVSATINPILYSIMSLKFREAFKDTLGRCCGRRPRAGTYETESRFYAHKSQV